MTLLFPHSAPPARVDSFGQARSKTEYASFPRMAPGSVAGAHKLRICIITQDFVGPIKNGGIGTAYTYAAQALSRAGHDVTVLFSNFQCVSRTLEYWQKYYSGQGIHFVPLPEPEVPIHQGPSSEPLKVNYAVYEWMKQKDGAFDVVHASEWNANAYLCLHAKSLGLAFQDTQFVIKASSPTLWNKIGNTEPITELKTLIIMFMERRSIELADYVVSGSRYMLNWMEDQGYTIPHERSYVQPNIFPIEDVLSDVARSSTERVKELVFFGRLEPRKGIHIFFDALLQLGGEGFFENTQGIGITLLGKPKKGFNIKAGIKRLAKEFGVKVQVLDDKSQPECLEYLASGSGQVAIMPSVMDNSPFGVYECLAKGIPFISSDAGGGKELIAEESWGEVLFECSPSALAEKIQQIVDAGCPLARPSFDFEENIDQWLGWHQWLTKKDTSHPRVQVSPNSDPLVSVCVAHHNRGKLLLRALDSIFQQSYGNIEVIITDDGSTDPGSIKILEQIESTDQAVPVRIVRQSNRYLGAVRNNSARHAKGKYLLFMDDDNEAMSHEIETFVKVAEATEHDILTCYSDVFSGNCPDDSDIPRRRIVYHGNNLAVGIIRNPFGDSNCFVRKEAFDTLGGFTEHYKVGKDDMEFFARATLAGKSVTFIPEVLYWYRINKVRMRHNQYSQYAGLIRVSEPYTQNLHPDFANIVRYAQGLAYEVGPWGTARCNRKIGFGIFSVNAFSTPALELFRRIIAKYPWLYKIAYKVYKRL